MTNHYVPDQEPAPVVRVDVEPLAWTPRPHVTRSVPENAPSPGRTYSLTECNGMPDYHYSGHSERHGPLSDL